MSRPKKIPNLAENIKPGGKAKADQIICPVIRSNNEKHILEELWESGEYPEIKAVGYAKIGKAWASYTITTKGSEVTKIEISEPDIKAIADESCKIAYVTTFVDQE